MITKEDVLNWHGSDHNLSELADIVAEIANGKYLPSTLKRDIVNSKE